MRRVATGLAILGLVLGTATAALAKWVWRNDRWVYVEETPPAGAPKAPPAVKPAPPAPPAPPKVEPAPVAPTAPPVGEPAPPASPTAPRPQPVVQTPRETAAPPPPPVAGETAPAETAKPSWWQENTAWWRNIMKPQDDSLLFAQGCAQLESKDYRAAARTFKTLIKDSPTSPHREEAMWLRAAAFWGLEDYFKAFEQYEELLTTYAGSPHYRDALLKEIEVAEILFGPTRRKVLGIPLTSGDTEAVEILRKVYEHQPTGDLADDVVLRIADYYWSQNQWAEAEDYYDKYCREYPNGEAARKAELYRAKCAIERCRGARYDTTSLQLAYDRLRAFQQKFPADAEKEDVGALLAQVRDMQAEALYQTVLHYVRSGRADAAAFYVDRLQERFPDSPWSEKAKKFLADLAMGHEPQKPEPKKQEPKP